MAKSWYSRRNIKEQFKKLPAVAQDGCFPGSELGVLIWIAFYPVK